VKSFFYEDKTILNRADMKSTETSFFPHHAFLPSLLFLATALTGCGGGSSQVSTAGASGPSTATSNALGPCNLTLDTYKQALAITSVTSARQVSEAVGCDPDPTVKITTNTGKYSDYDVHTYTWTDKNSGYNFSISGFTELKGPSPVRFDIYAMYTKTMPNQCKVDFFDSQKIFGKTIEQANQLLKCNGSIESYSRGSPEQIVSTVLWGQPNLPTLTATTFDGVIDRLTSSDNSDAACNPGLSEWLQISIGDDLEKVKAKTKCRGQLYVESACYPSAFDPTRFVTTFHTSTTLQPFPLYPRGGAGAGASFENNVVSSTFLNLPELTENCGVTQQAVEKIFSGMKRSAITAIIGCEPNRQYFSRKSNDKFTSEAQWQEYSVDSRLGTMYIHFDNYDAVYTAFSNFSPPNTQCDAPQSILDTIQVGDTYSIVVQKIGCEGVLLLKTTKDNMSYSTYGWQTGLRNTGGSDVSFSNGQVTRTYTNR
jgi:hypothetical protein